MWPDRHSHSQTPRHDVRRPINQYRNSALPMTTMSISKAASKGLAALVTSAEEGNPTQLLKSGRVVAEIDSTEEFSALRQDRDTLHDAPYASSAKATKNAQSPSDNPPNTQSKNTSATHDPHSKTNTPKTHYCSEPAENASTPAKPAK